MHGSEYKKKLYKRHLDLTRAIVQKFQQRISEENIEISSRDIVDLPEFRACIELITNDPALEAFKLTTSFNLDEYQSFCEGALLNFLQWPLYRWKRFDKEDFEVLYKERELCVCPDEKDYKIIGYLTHSFESEEEGINLRDGVKIKKLSKEELSLLSLNETNNLSLGKYGLEIQGKFRCSPHPDIYPQAHFQNERNSILCSWAKAPCQKVVWALRLFKEADVNIPCLSLFWSSLSSTFGCYTHFRVDPFYAPTVYKLTEEERLWTL